jgi:FKBP-type peptidyl-prolyl cis-trans isomerase 2
MEMALQGMCVGEQVEVDIPPNLAFEEKGKTYKSPVPKVRFRRCLLNSFSCGNK